MPNWCENRMTISHTDEAKIMEVIAAATQTGLFNYFYPMPEELRGTVADHSVAQNDEQKALIEKYGAKDWYSWALSNWGTKWDVRDANASEVFFNPGTQRFTVDLDYETAWGPGTEALQRGVNDKGFTIDNFYIEGGVGFCGVWEGSPEAGCNDTCISFADEDLDTEEKIDAFVKDIPTSLEEAFALRERFLGNLDWLNNNLPDLPKSSPEA